ncbi:LIC_10190 family membrane protein [Chlorogloeopsis fritschii PCC 9212]|nr:hypothetical protein [Chlorogloeopsis fritschii]
MLYFIASWTVLLISCSVIGIALLNYLGANLFTRVGDRLMAAEWLGMIVLSICLLAVSLVLPLSSLTGILVAVTLCGVSFVSRRTRIEVVALLKASSWQLVLSYIGLAIAVAAFTNRQVTWIDTGLYHYSVIQWLHQYGTVTGVALIFSNLGFTSSWFALAAPFNPPSLEARVSAVTNGFIFLLAILHFLACLRHSIKGKALFSDWFALAFLGLLLPFTLLYNLFREILISPSPDLPTGLLIGIGCWAILVVSNPQSSTLPDSKNLGNGNAQAVPLILSVGALTIKLTAIPLMLVTSLFYAVHHRRSITKLCIGGAIALVLLAPMLAAGIKASSCPLYPSSIFCLDLPWLPDAQNINQVAQGTHGWSNWYGKPPEGRNRWLWLLLTWLNSERPNQVMVAVVIATIVGMIITFKSFRKIPIKGKYWIVAIEVLGFLFLMMTAPFFRFALPYLLLIPSLLIAIYAQSLLSQSVSMVSKYSQPSAIAFSLAFIAAIVAIFTQTHTTSQWLLPPAMQRVPVIQRRVNDIVYFYPLNKKLCWATELPCGFEIEPNVRLRDRDRGIAGGFIYTKD